ncbi:hypothetical protein RHSIM_Rhsim02G0035400 [Rhododendron simsii]|uniref:Uncharacterized protein n=1 Tax=Rhododendron simsii TaxID=118357 RepID=A0A834HFS2_RHOSS|nr:hypothetical protein RHSIM_Rhsim02G0035400 [Rhododendron simsii]
MRVSVCTAIRSSVRLFSGDETRNSLSFSLSLSKTTVMGFSSFLGRVFFASLFILSAWQMYSLSLSLSLSPHVLFLGILVLGFIGFTVINDRVPYASVLLSRFDEFGTDGGPAAKELSPKLAVVQRFLTSKLGEGVTYFIAASIVLKGLGGALFVFGSSLGAYLLLYHLAYTTPLLYDFFNYKYGEPEFSVLLQEFLQCMAYFGALLYFLGMKNSITKKQLKKKTQKTKTS